MIANARMYAINPPAAAAWRSLLEWVIERAGVPCAVIDYPPPQPLAALWTRADLACAFMCGYPLMQAAVRPFILAAPVPSPAAYRQRPIYWSELVVRADAAIERIEDLFGKRFAFTLDNSQSGYQAPRAFFAPYAAQRNGKLFASTIGPLVTPRRVVEAILSDEADAGPVDSYALELFRAHEPELAARLRTIDATAATPIPPLVASTDIAPADALRLRAALLDVESASKLRDVRTALRLQRFAQVQPSDYTVLLERAHEADTMGYPRLA